MAPLSATVKEALFGPCSPSRNGYEVSAVLGMRSQPADRSRQGTPYYQRWMAEVETDGHPRRVDGVRRAAQVTGLRHW